MKDKRKKTVVGFATADSDADMDVYFEYFVGSYRPGMVHQVREWQPATDLYETETHVLVKTEIAGIDPDDIEVVLDKDSLILQGQRQEQRDGERKRAHVMEVHYGPFKRTFPLPCPVCAENARADYDRGLLTIRLQKRDKPLQRKVRVKIR